jgi:hypothetical protein
LCLFDGRRSRTGRCPDPRQGTLLAEACFILKPNFDDLVRIFLCDAFDLFYGVFLKAACASGSVFLCRGRGTRQL